MGVIQLIVAVWASPKVSVGAPDQLTVNQHSKSERWYPSDLLLADGQLVRGPHRFLGEGPQLILTLTKLKMARVGRESRWG